MLITLSGQEPQIRAPEGMRCFATEDVLQSKDPEITAKHNTRQLLWIIWERCSGSDLKDHPAALAGNFADYPIENLDLVREVEASFRTDEFGPSMEVLQQLEQRAVPSGFATDSSPNNWDAVLLCPEHIINFPHDLLRPLNSSSNHRLTARAGASFEKVFCCLQMTGDQNSSDDADHALAPFVHWEGILYFRFLFV